MITRIVRMEFHPGHVEDFLAQFDGVKDLIRAYPGVQHLELHRDAGQANVFYTFSRWDDEAALETYRQSSLFRTAWSEVKPWFSAKPQAFSLTREMIVSETAEPARD